MIDSIEEKIKVGKLGQQWVCHLSCSKSFWLNTLFFIVLNSSLGSGLFLVQHFGLLDIFLLTGGYLADAGTVLSFFK